MSCPLGVPAVVWLERGAQDHPESGVPAAVLHPLEGRTVMTVIIGIDPHKASHAACAIDDTEVELDRLLCWARPFEARTWAIESAGGLGYLLAQQLVGAGEAVVDVPATLSSRV